MGGKPRRRSELDAGYRGLSHFDAGGSARMVNVSPKDETVRVAVATGRVEMAPETARRIADGQIGKGDVLGVARLAAIQAAKRTSDLIPLCHPLRLTAIDVAFDVATRSPAGVSISVTVQARDRTGVEMEALTAVSVAALTIYDMCKAVDRAMSFHAIGLREKRGGKSGTWIRS